MRSTPVAERSNGYPRFVASPLLVCGTDASIGHEYLNQDYIYDDYGSDTRRRLIRSGPG